MRTGGGSSTLTEGEATARCRQPTVRRGGGTPAAQAGRAPAQARVPNPARMGGTKAMAAVSKGGGGWAEEEEGACGEGVSIKIGSWEDGQAAASW